MADEKKELTKTQKDLKNNLKGFNETIEKNTSKFSKSMSNVIKKMAEVNAPLAAQLSDIRASGRDSFAAALQTKKAIELNTTLTNLQSENIDVSIKDREQLSKIFAKYGATDFDFDAFATVEKELEESAKNVIRVEKRRADLERRRDNEVTKLEQDRQAELDRRYKSTNKLGKMQAIVDKANADMLADQNMKGAVYKNALALRDKTQQELDIAHKAMFEKEDEAIEVKKKGYDVLLEKIDEDAKAQNEVYEEKKKESDDLKAVVSDVSKELQEDAGRFGQFSDGIKELTGIDLQGMADSVVGSINAVGKVFGKEQLFASVMDSVVSNVGDAMGSIANNFSGLGKALAPVGAAMTGGIASFTKGGVTLGGVLSGIGTAMSVTAKGLMTSGMLFLKGLGGVIKQMLIAGGKFLLTIPMLIANSLIFIGGLMLTIAGLLISALPFIAVGLLIVGAIGLVIAAFNYLYENVEWFRTSIDWLVDAFWGIYQFLKDFISGNVFGSIKTYIGDIFGGIKDFFMGVVDFVKAALSGDIGGMKDAIGKIFSSIKDLFLAPFKFVKNLIMGEDPEGLDEAQESGLYDLDRVGDSEIDKDKVKNAPMGQLKAIVAHDDLDEKDMALIKEEIARQEAVNLSVNEPSTGQEIGEKTIDAEKEKAVASTMNNVITDASSNTSNTNNVIHSSGSAKDTSNASRLAAQSY